MGLSWASHSTLIYTSEFILSSTNQSASQPVRSSVSPSVSQPVRQSARQSVSQSTPRQVLRDYYAPVYSGTAGGYRVDSGLHSSLGNIKSSSSSLKNTKVEKANSQDRQVGVEQTMAKFRLILTKVFR